KVRMIRFAQATSESVRDVWYRHDMPHFLSNETCPTPFKSFPMLGHAGWHWCVLCTAPHSMDPAAASLCTSGEMPSTMSSTEWTYRRPVWAGAINDYKGWVPWYSLGSQAR